MLEQKDSGQKSGAFYHLISSKLSKSKYFRTNGNIPNVQCFTVLLVWNVLYVPEMQKHTIIKQNRVVDSNCERNWVNTVTNGIKVQVDIKICAIFYLMHFLAPTD